MRQRWKDERTPSDKAKVVIELGDRLFSNRATMESLWQQIADQFYPERAEFTLQRTPGAEFADHLMTSYPVKLREELASSIQAMLRPPGQKWFGMSSGREEIDQHDSAAPWLERSGLRLWRALEDPKALFMRATTAADHDFVAFGNAVLTVERHPAGIGFLLQNWHLRDVAWAENALREVDTVARRFKGTARGLLQEFGRQHVCDKVVEMMEKNPYGDVPCFSVVVPVEVWDYAYTGESENAKARRREAFPFMQIVVDKAHEHVMRETPLRINPYVIVRWRLSTLSPYAFAPPTIIGLPDARLLQRMTLSMLESAEKGVDPPLIARGEKLRGGVNVYAGGVTYVDPDYDDRTGKVVEALFETQAFEPAKEFYDRHMAMMKDLFYLNKLTLPEFKDMTAFEVQKRMEEFARAATPLFGPLETEYNGRVLEKSIAIGFQTDLFGPREEIPAVLRGRELAFTYKSPLRQAAEEVKAQQLGTGLQLMQGAAAFDPTVPQNVDLNKATRESLRGLGWPSGWIKPEDQVQQEREAQAKQQQAEAAMQQVQQGGEAAGAVAGAAKDAAAAGINIPSLLQGLGGAAA
ncbi:portal protein [Xanthobacter flavus]|uniref:portal protein n=1 Tax=Xanthobacter flavus TaxID=281 RepID=UPI001AE8DF5E|nr:portal protein [Xanthobacter flavus]MBP2147405.1 hypothetical protein [Xanthobacter flavus]